MNDAEFIFFMRDKLNSFHISNKETKKVYTYRMYQALSKLKTLTACLNLHTNVRSIEKFFRVRIFI